MTWTPKGFKRRIVGVSTSIACFIFIGTLAGRAAEGWQLRGFEKTDAPVLTPTASSTFPCPIRGKSVAWEEKDVFNPAAVVRDGKVWLIYRAQDVVGAKTAYSGGTSRLGLAWSDDGLNFTRQEAPILYPAHDSMERYEWEGGCEDPRIVEDEQGRYILTYTAYDGKTARLATAASADLIHWQKRGLAFEGDMRDEWTKSGAIVARQAGDRFMAARIHGKYWMYFRDSRLLLASSTDLIHWTTERDEAGKPKIIFGARTGKFDSELVEPGPPAILRNDGILLLYNGVNAKTNNDPLLPAGTFSSGQILFDASEPSRVLRRSDSYFLKPDRPYEMTGQVGNVCFIEGLVPFKRGWFLYYGTADSRIGAAVARPPKFGTR